MRRTIRKTFLLEGETVTMKYVTLWSHDRGRKGEILRESHRRAVLSYAGGLADHLVPAGLTLLNRRRPAAFPLPLWPQRSPCVGENAHAQLHAASRLSRALPPSVGQERRRA